MTPVQSFLSACDAVLRSHPGTEIDAWAERRDRVRIVRLRTRDAGAVDALLFLAERFEVDVDFGACPGLALPEWVVRKARAA